MTRTLDRRLFVASRRPWVPRVAGVLCALIGLVDIVSAVTRAERARVRELHRFVPGTLSSASAALTLVAGISLLLLAHALRRRKRRAWRAVVALLLVSAVLHVLKGLDVEEATLSVVLLAGLLRYHDEFRASGDPRTRWRAIGAFVVLGVSSFLLGLVVIYLRRHALVHGFHLRAAAGQVLRYLVGQEPSTLWRPTREGRHAADLVSDSILALGALTVLTTSYLALRPAEPVCGLTPSDEERMRALLAAHGSRDSLGYFALRRDKSVIWSPTGKACIGYRVVSGVMLASGDPLGDPEAWPGAIQEFLLLARDHAWTPAVMGCSEAAGTAWRRVGLDALEIGDEAIVEVADFTLEGRAMRNVRQAVARVERAGYSCEVKRVRDMPEDEQERLREQAASWRGTETERGFSMALGRFGDPADGDCVAVMARKDGLLRAFLHFVPWGAEGLSLDLMRRDRGADNGVNELLIVAALRAAPELGVRRLSLNFAVFRSALERGERLGAGPVIRAWRGLLLFLSRWFQIESLYRFNAKFRPVWEPRYVCFASVADLPRVALAALEAEAFLVWPRLSFLRRTRAAEPQRSTVLISG